MRGKARLEVSKMNTDFYCTVALTVRSGESEQSEAAKRTRVGCWASAQACPTIRERKGIN